MTDTSGNDEVLAALNQILAQQEEQRELAFELKELAEEIIERLADLSVPYSTGFEEVDS